MVISSLVFNNLNYIGPTSCIVSQKSVMCDPNALTALPVTSTVCSRSLVAVCRLAHCSVEYVTNSLLAASSDPDNDVKLLYTQSVTAQFSKSFSNSSLTV